MSDYIDLNELQCVLPVAFTAKNTLLKKMKHQPTSTFKTYHKRHACTAAMVVQVDANSLNNKHYKNTSYLKKKKERRQFLRGVSSSQKLLSHLITSVSSKECTITPCFKDVRLCAGQWRDKLSFPLVFVTKDLHHRF